jgi:hypothetical protein
VEGGETVTVADPKLTRPLEALRAAGGPRPRGRGAHYGLAHPTAFLAFLLVGGTLVGLGVLLYLYAIVSN